MTLLLLSMGNGVCWRKLGYTKSERIGKLILQKEWKGRGEGEKKITRKEKWGKVDWIEHKNNSESCRTQDKMERVTKYEAGFKTGDDDFGSPNSPHQLPQEACRGSVRGWEHWIQCVQAGSELGSRGELWGCMRGHSRKSLQTSQKKGPPKREESQKGKLNFKPEGLIAWTQPWSKWMNKMNEISDQNIL